jgi:Plasmid pRiA4b ORF-3-like protein
VTGTVRRLKVTLRQVKPPVWRRVEVQSDVTLQELAALLEAAMRWMGGHLHSFTAGRREYGTPDPDWPIDFLDEAEHRLGEVLTDVGSKMRWDYDFTDDPYHAVVSSTGSS